LTFNGPESFHGLVISGVNLDDRLSAPHARVRQECRTTGDGNERLPAGAAIPNIEHLTSNVEHPREEEPSAETDHFGEREVE
jgi:hypothetical protein